jgi:hypothetical protein
MMGGKFSHPVGAIKSILFVGQIFPQTTETTHIPLYLKNKILLAKATHQ